MREGWEIKTLADLFDIGSSKRVYESQWRDSGVPFYRAREIVKLSREGFVDNELFIDEDLYNEYANKYGIPKCGDIMVTGVGTLGVCYIVKENDKFYFKDGNTLWFKSKKETNPFFVNYAFKSNYLRQQIDNCNGATVGTFTIVRAKQTKIPIPPLSEQQRIVSELDLLSSIIEKKKAQLKEYDQLAQSIFHDMFGDPVTNEKGWEVKKLGEVCREVGDGLHGTPNYDPNGKIAFINGNNLINGKITITEKTLFVNDIEAKEIYIELDTNTVLLSINGTLGKTAIYNNENVVLGKSACYCKLTNRLNVKYVISLMNTNAFKGFLENNSSKSTIKNVGLKAIRNYSIILPPLPLQQSFASKIEAIERQKALVQQSITEAETLFNSRMDYWFS